MKKLLGMILTLALAAGLAWPVYAESSTVPPEVTAHAYLVMDAQTGQVLVQKGGAERNYPASITKIMTLALAMEKCGGDMTQQVTVSPDAVYSLEAGSSHVALQPERSCLSTICYMPRSWPVPTTRPMCWQSTPPAAWRRLWS